MSTSSMVELSPDDVNAPAFAGRSFVLSLTDITVGHLFIINSPKTRDGTLTDRLDKGKTIEEGRKRRSEKERVVSNYLKLHLCSDLTG